MVRAAEDKAFTSPPVVCNERGEVRTAGFELEYAGVNVEESAELVRQVFGGTIEVESTFVHRVRGTRYGDFTVEIDTVMLKDKKYEKALDAVGLYAEKLDRRKVETALLEVFSTVVPIEVSTPGIPITELGLLEELRRLLHERNAQGSRASLLYAFGMHINPEIPGRDPAVLRDFLRAFLLLYPWLARRVEVDISRRMTPYINPFPAEYARLVLAEDYPADRDRLVDDYLKLNPTRNRPLDMLPVFTWLDEARVHRQVPDTHLVKPRAAFHYRLPNCMIDEPDWTLAREWNTWVAVERMAADPDRLAHMARDYLEADEHSFWPFFDKWPGVLEGYMRDVREQAAAAAPMVDEDMAAAEASDRT